MISLSTIKPDLQNGIAVKEDPSLLKLQKRVQLKNRQKSKKLHTLRRKSLEKRQKQRERRKNNLIASWNRKDKAKLEKKTSQYKKLKKKHHRFLNYLRRRQEKVETENSGRLSKKSYKQMNKKYRDYVREREKRMEEIKNFKKAFDWGDLREREQRIKQENLEKEQKRETERKNFLKDFHKNDLYVNKKVLKRVQSMDSSYFANKRNDMDMFERQKKFSDMVKESFLPATSRRMEEETLKNIQKAHFGRFLRSEREKMGQKNLSLGHRFLDASTKIGRTLKDQKLARSSAGGAGLHKSVTFLLDGEKVENGQNLPLKKINSSTTVKTSLRAEREAKRQERKAVEALKKIGNSNMNFMKKMNIPYKTAVEQNSRISGDHPAFKLKNKRLKKGGEVTEEKLRIIDNEVKVLQSLADVETKKARSKLSSKFEAMDAQEKADYLLIQSMMAKCLISDAALDGEVQAEFQIPDKQYPKPKPQIDYKTARFRLVKPGEKRQKKEPIKPKKMPKSSTKPSRNNLVTEESGKTKNSGKNPLTSVSKSGYHLTVDKPPFDQNSNLRKSGSNLFDGDNHSEVNLGFSDYPEFKSEGESDGGGKEKIGGFGSLIGQGGLGFGQESEIKIHRSDHGTGEVDNEAGSGFVIGDHRSDGGKVSRSGIGGDNRNPGGEDEEDGLGGGFGDDDSYLGGEGEFEDLEEGEKEEFGTGGQEGELGFEGIGGEEEEYYGEGEEEFGGTGGRYGEGEEEFGGTGEEEERIDTGGDVGEFGGGALGGQMDDY